MAHSVSYFCLQTVVDGIELIDLVVRLEQGIVVDRIKRQNPEFLTLIQVPAAHGCSDALRANSCTAKRIARIAAVLNQLLHQRGIRRVAIPLSIYVDAHGTDVGNVQHIVASQLSLHVQIPVVAGSIRKVRVKDYFAGGQRAVRYRRGGLLCRDDNRDTTSAESVVDRLHRKLGVTKLERRVSACIAENITEDPVMENTKSGSHGSSFRHARGPKTSRCAARCLCNPDDKG